VRGGLRIIGGEWGGRRLSVPTAPGLRPTADRNRETLFNWLQADCSGARVLDLFAGTGALGIEALSRGAASAVFVERSRPIAASLKERIALLGAESRADIQCMDALAYCRSNPGPFNLIFLDPPFGKDLLVPALELVSAQTILAGDARVYVEAPLQPAPPTLPESWSVIREKTAGAVWFALLEDRR